jgi:FkbH-like protein
MGMERAAIQRIRGPEKKTIKCIVWDLDNTLWDGILLEDRDVFVKAGVTEIIKALDQRGILHSIASRNDRVVAEQKLRQSGLYEYFLCPQINWNAKSSSLQEIMRVLNLGPDAFAFVDDQSFEREEVAFAFPDVLCIDAQDIDTLLDMPEMMPRFLTEDAHRRRLLYHYDQQRAEAEKSFVGPDEAFLAALNMIFTIAPAREEDLQRAEELTVRTHQLNTTGYTYSYDELHALRLSPRHQLLFASLDDKYGPYGKIGLALLEQDRDVWTIKLLLMSCRVMSRGVGTMMLAHILQMARRAGVRLQADFVPTERNRMMYVTYKFSGFKEIRTSDTLITLEHSLDQIPAIPDYVQFHAVEADKSAYEETAIVAHVKIF